MAESAIQIDVPWEAIDKALRAVKGKEFSTFYSTAVDSLSLQALTLLKEKTPRSAPRVGEGRSRGRHLAEFWAREVSKEAGIIKQIVLRNVAPHSHVLAYLEYGTRPHTIRGRPLLRFVTEEGEVVYTRVVHHPGTKPLRIVATVKEWLEEALSKLEDEFRKRLR